MLGDEQTSIKLFEKAAETTDADSHGHGRHHGHRGDGKPFIEGDTHVNATIGKSVALTCHVHNVKNYKVTGFHFHFKYRLYELSNIQADSF